MIVRVVFDTSTLIGAILKAGSKPYQALRLALEFCVLCGNEQLLAELTEVLSRSYFDRRLSQFDRDSFLAMIRKNIEKNGIIQTNTVTLDPPCRDVSDDFILTLALATGADAIVTSDNDLLVLHPWRGLSVLTPAQFVSQFSS